MTPTWGPLCCASPELEHQSERCMRRKHHLTGPLPPALHPPESPKSPAVWLQPQLCQRQVPTREAKVTPGVGCWPQFPCDSKPASYLGINSVIQGEVSA